MITECPDCGKPMERIKNCVERLKKVGMRHCSGCKRLYVYNHIGVVVAVFKDVDG